MSWLDDAGETLTQGATWAEEQLEASALALSAPAQAAMTLFRTYLDDYRDHRKAVEAATSPEAQLRDRARTEREAARPEERLLPEPPGAVYEGRQIHYEGGGAEVDATGQLVWKPGQWVVDTPGTLAGYTLEPSPETIIKTRHKTAEGRPVIPQPDGSVMTEKSITVEGPGGFVNIPTVFNGQVVPDEEAVSRVEQAGWTDPETGRVLPAYPTEQAAVDAAQARSAALGEEVQTETPIPDVLPDAIGRDAASSALRVLEVLGVPQELVMGILTNRVGERMTVAEFIQEQLPGAQDVFYDRMKQLTGSETAAGLLAAMPAFALAVATDPLNVLPMGPARRLGGTVAEHLAQSTQKTWTVTEARNLLSRTPTEMQWAGADAYLSKVEPGTLLTKDDLRQHLVPAQLQVTETPPVTVLDGPHTGTQSFTVTHPASGQAAYTLTTSSRVNATEQPVLLIEHIQESSPATPATESAVMTAGVHRMMRVAAENGYHALAWTPTETASALPRPVAAISPATFEAALERARVTGAAGPPIERGASQQALAAVLHNLDAGRLSSDDFVRQVDDVYAGLDRQRAEAQGQPTAGVPRGAAYIRTRLRQAERRGEIDPEMRRLTEWFLKGNEQVFEGLTVSITQPWDPSIAGSYYPIKRILRIAKGEMPVGTAVHEMLHHLERLMPVSYQQAIRTAWLQDYLKTYATGSESSRAYLQAALRASVSGSERDFDEVVRFFEQNVVGQDMYPYLNASEWWAVHGTALLQQQSMGIWGEIRHWLRKALAKVQQAAGVESKAAIFDALDWLRTKGTRTEQSPSMLREWPLEASKAMSAYLRPWEGAVESRVLPGVAHEVPVYYAPVTPQMREAVLQDPRTLVGATYQIVTRAVEDLPAMWTPKVQQQAQAQLDAFEQRVVAGETPLTATPATLVMTRVAAGILASASGETAEAADTAGGDPSGWLQNKIAAAAFAVGVGALAMPSLLRTLARLRRPAGRVVKPVEMGPTELALSPTEIQQRITEARRGIRHDPVVAQEAAELVAGTRQMTAGPTDMTLETIRNMVPGTTLNDTQLTALYRVLTPELDRVLRLAADAQTPAQLTEFVKAFKNFAYVINPKRLGAEAETGRGLRILGTNPPLDVLTQRQRLAYFDQLVAHAGADTSPEQLRDMVLRTPTPEALTQLAQHAAKPGFKEMLQEYWLSAQLLSSPITHTFNVLGNTWHMGQLLLERQVSGLTPGSHVAATEAWHGVQAIWGSFFDALHAAAQVFRGDPTAVMIGSRAFDIGATTKTELAAQHALTAENLALTGVPGRAIDMLGHAIRLSGTALTAEDTFFKTIALNAEVRMHAARRATDAVRESGASGDAARTLRARVMERTFQDMPEAVAEGAEQFAAYATFTKELGPLGQWIKAGASEHFAIRMVAPFVQAPANIFKAANERTPLGLFSRSLHEAMRKGGAEADLALARLGLGSMMVGAASLLASEGVVTGGGPADPDSRRLMFGLGWRPYAFNLSAFQRLAAGHSPAWQTGDALYTYNRYEPLGTVLGWAANWTDAVYGHEAKAGEPLEDVGLRLAIGTAKTAVDKSFVQGFARMTSAWAFKGEAAHDLLVSEAVSFVPLVGSSASRFVRRQLDPVMREVDGLLDTLRNNTPGLSASLPPKRDALTGDPLPVSSAWGAQVQRDPVREALLANEVPPHRAPTSIQGIALTPQEYDDYQLAITREAQPLSGKNLYQSLAQVLTDPFYREGKAGRESRRGEILSSILEAARAQGQALFIQSHPEFQKKLMHQAAQKADAMASRGVTVGGR